MLLIENGSSLSQTETLTDYDEFPFEFDGDSDSDSRVHMKASGPVKVLGLSYDIESEDNPSRKEPKQ